MPIGKRLTADQKAEIIRLRIDEGLPVWGIAEKFDLCRDTVFKIIREWKKHGESAISDDEKEPDTVAAVTDSEQEDCVEVPADIIHDNSENVKPVDDLLPCAVVDAIADQIDRLYDSLTECDRKVQEIQTARANVENDLKELRVFLKENGYGDVVKALDSGAKWRALQGEK